MMAFRACLLVMWLAVAGYTLVVIPEHGTDLLAVFLRDIRALDWPGQFHLDFLCFLLLCGLWVAWRHDFSPKGLSLGLLASVGGLLFLAPYLLVLSIQARGSVREVLIGGKGASA